MEKTIRQNGGIAGGILMDQSKAFDTINHERLIAKLEAYGFDHDALAILLSYLPERWHRTKINKCQYLAGNIEWCATRVHIGSAFV